MQDSKDKQVANTAVSEVLKSAFPIPLDDRPGSYPAEAGMTLRDYFAAKALPLAIQSLNNLKNDSWDDSFAWHSKDDGDEPSSDQELAAEYAYSMADAMINARG